MTGGASRKQGAYDGDAERASAARDYDMTILKFHDSPCAGRLAADAYA
jgi:hypothetical protein